MPVPLHPELSDTSTSDRFTPLTRHVQSLVDQDSIVGAEVYIEQGGHVLLRTAFGWHDRERGVQMPPDAIFRMRSMTKPLVGTAVLMLYEEGKLALEDPIARYIPAFDNGVKRAITIHHLLTHTSGLIGEIYDTLQGTAFGTLREAVDWVGRDGPVGFAPGTAFHYSDPGSSTLGALVAEASGMLCESFIHSRARSHMERLIVIPMAMERRSGVPKAPVRTGEV